MSNRHMHRGENYRFSGSATGLGAILMLEYFTRLQCGICGPKPVPGKKFTDAVWIEAGYAIDAPAMLPAGGMTSFTIQGMDDAMPEQITVEREAA